MLARTRVKAETIDSELTEAHLDALLDLAARLRSGEIKHRPDEKLEIRGKGKWFNMQAWHCRWQCGTVMCAGGWLEHLHPELNWDAVGLFNGGRLGRLFYGFADERNQDRTPEETADAIERLVAGHEPWPDIRRATK